MKLLSNISEIDINKWQKFVQENQGCAGWEFILSQEWIEILKSKQEEFKLLMVVNEQEEILSILLLRKIKYEIKLGKAFLPKFFYWYAPRGPLFKNNLRTGEIKDLMKFLLPEIKKIDSKALFLRLEPSNKTTDFWQDQILSKEYNPFSFKRSTAVQPQETLILDLKLSQDDLLKNMHPKTRYNIRLAEKKDLVFKAGQIEDFPEFWRLMEKTGDRDGFRLHPAKHYQGLIKQTDLVRLFFIEHQGEKIATALLSLFHQQATYLHGASDYQYRQLMAPHLLQWEMIKWAQAQGASIYDFYGISQEKWPGVTRFKQGFRGQKRSYPGTFELIFRPKLYKLYQLAKKFN